MKAFLIVLLFAISILSYSQTSQPSFNWKSREIKKDAILKGMAVHDEATAVIAGDGGTFRISSDKGLSWSDVGLLNPRFNYIDLSLEGSVGYMVGRKASLVVYPTGGEADVYQDGVILKTTNGGISWSLIDLAGIGEGTNPELNPNAGGCIYRDPYSVLCLNETDALIYIQWQDVTSATKKTHSAVFKTTDGGIKWTAITKDFGVAYINAIRRSGNDVYIGGNKILLKYSLESNQLTDIFPVFSAVAGSAAFVNDVRFYKNETMVLTTSGCYLTADSGASFSKINGLSGGNDILKLDDNVLLNIGTSSNSKASTDGGKTWVACYPGKSCWEIPGVFNDSVYCLSSSVIFKMSVADLKSGKFKWVTATISDGSYNLQKMQIFDSQTALLSGFNQIVKMTRNGGLTWDDVNVPALFTGGKYDFRAIASAGRGGYLVSRPWKLVDYSAGEDYYLNGLIFKTTSNWKKWSVLNAKNIGKDHSTDASLNPTMAGCFALDNYAVECVDTVKAFLFSIWSDSVSVPHSIIKHSRIFKTIDGGDSWSSATADLGGATINSIKISGNTGFAAGEKILLRTTDGGASFNDIYPRIAAVAEGDLVINTVSIGGNNVVYCQTSNGKGAFVSKDGGNTFSSVAGTSGGVDFVALDDNSFMSLGASSLSKYSNDGGSTWTNANLDALVYAAGKVYNDSLYVLGKTNVYKIAVSDLKINTATFELQQVSSLLRVTYSSSAIVLSADNRDIERCMIYNISGQLVSVVDPRDQICLLEYGSFKPGIYIVAAVVDGKRYSQRVIFR